MRVVLGKGILSIVCSLLGTMHLSVTSISAVFSLLYAPAFSQTFQLKDQFVGKDFLTGFKWETFDDPTHGRVNYVDQPTALQKNLTVGKSERTFSAWDVSSDLSGSRCPVPLPSAQGTQFIMRADSTSTVALSARGRDSIRITSHSTYTDAVIVLDVSHMPTGCATWPAFWTVTSGQWPIGGEIDIIEGCFLRQIAGT